MILPGATSTDTISLAELNTLRNNLSKIDLRDGIDINFISNPKIKNKLVEAATKRKSLYDAIDAREKLF